MMNPVYAVHYTKSGNIGDALASPLRYLDVRRPVEVVDLGEWDNRGDVVLGGGGLLFKDTEPQLKSAGDDIAHKRILWGVGTNYMGETKLIHPDWLDGFDLVGLRDLGSKRLVMCPSCLHPEFDTKRSEPTLDAVVYEHPGEIPLTQFVKWTNHQPIDAFGAVLDFLALARVVITNSYHGSYWATLLGREVMTWCPNSNRHLHTPWPVHICNAENWENQLKASLFLFKCKKYPTHWLEWARKTNMTFYEEAKALLTRTK